jgi:hypothetical protein
MYMGLIVGLMKLRMQVFTGDVCICVKRVYMRPV